METFTLYFTLLLLDIAADAGNPLNAWDESMQRGMQFLELLKYLYNLPTKNGKDSVDDKVELKVDVRGSLVKGKFFDDVAVFLSFPLLPFSRYYFYLYIRV